MATRPFLEYETITPPLSSPPLESPAVLQFPPSSSLNSSFPFTPPPSLPTSSPGSPEYHNKELQGLISEETGGLCKMTPISPKLNKSDSRISSLKKPGKIKSAFTDHVEVSALPEGYGDSQARPILPKTRISFPSVFSDDEEGGVRLVGKKEKSTKTPRRRVVSQETIITTTSTKKSEKRKIRYSTSILDEMEDEALQQFRTSRSKSRSSAAGRTSSSDPPNDNASNKATSSRSSRKPRPSTASPRRSVSRQRHRSTQQPPSISPPLPRVQSRRRRKPSSVSRPPNSSNALVPYSDYSSSDPPPYIIDEDYSYPLYQSPTAFTPTSIPLFRPVVNLFTFLLVSSFCCLTVSAVLVTSFSLTFYDDCTRRLNGLNRSLKTGRKSIEGGIGGVKEGMGRVLGNARGAIENAVKAAEGITTSNGEPRGGSSSDSKRTAMPIITTQDDYHGGEEEEENVTSSIDGKVMDEQIRSNSKTRSKGGGGGGANRNQAWKPRASPLRRSFNPFTAFTSSSTISSARVSTERANKSGWVTDEDALPYEVPHPTPFASRPVSPHRSPRARQRPSSQSQNDDDDELPPQRPAPTLPPRPHLAVLLPSLFLAVILTLAKLGYSFWKASKERQAQREREQREVEEWRYRQAHFGDDNYRGRTRTSYHN